MSVGTSLMLGALFPPSSLALPILQRSVLASRIQRPGEAKENRGAEAAGIRWEEKRAGGETRDGSRCQRV